MGDVTLGLRPSILVDQGSIYLAVGVDRSDTDVAQFVRLDVNQTTFLMGPTQARRLSKLLRQYADEITQARQR